MTRSCDLHGAETNTCQDTWSLSVWGQMKNDRFFHSVWKINDRIILITALICTSTQFLPTPGIGNAKCQQCCRCLDVIWAPSLRLRSLEKLCRGHFASAHIQWSLITEIWSFSRLYHRSTGANKLIIQFLISARQGFFWVEVEDILMRSEE